MNVKQLREIIQDMSDDVQLVGTSSDHSYRLVEVFPATALFNSSSRNWTEDYGEDSTPEADYGKRMNVLVIS